MSSSVKALVLLSGGLDSVLAAQLLKEQGLEVIGLSFNSYFFSITAAEAAVRKLGIKLKKVDISKEHLVLVKNPAHGYGKNLNPCIDCHALMLIKAKEIKEREGYNLIATGEVLGQRPMSQNLSALKLIEKVTGLTGQILRPLSAKLLPPTLSEESGLVNREKLEEIKGRSRQRQLELAKQFNIKSYSSPAGGCLLTDSGFSQRLSELLTNWPDSNGNDIALLKTGRVFWLTLDGEDGNLSAKTLLIISRNKEESERLPELSRPGDILLEIKDMTGPTALIRFKTKEKKEKQKQKEQEIDIAIPDNLEETKGLLEQMIGLSAAIKLSALLTGYYSPKARGQNIKVRIIYI